MTPHVSITLLRTQTDERLIELIAAGHDRAFDAVVDRYRRPLLRYARRFLHEEERAEDVVQTALVSAWTALREGTSVRDLRPWLYRIVHNGALNVMKNPGGEDVPLIEASDLRPGPALEVEQREDVRHALDTIAALPERQRAALLAVALEGRSHADVGVELGLNDNAVRQLVRRARVSLRVAATAITPWPAAVWLAGLGSHHAGDAAARVGEVVSGVGAGTLFGGGALKAGAVVAAAGAVAVSAPQVVEVVHHKRQAVASAAAAPAPKRSSDGDVNAAATAAQASRTLSVATPAGGSSGAAPSSGRSRGTRVGSVRISGPSSGFHSGGARSAPAKSLTRAPARAQEPTEDNQVSTGHRQRSTGEDAERRGRHQRRGNAPPVLGEDHAEEDAPTGEQHRESAAEPEDSTSGPEDRNEESEDSSRTETSGTSRESASSGSSGAPASESSSGSEPPQPESPTVTTPRP